MKGQAMLILGILIVGVIIALSVAQGQKNISYQNITQNLQISGNLTIPADNVTDGTFTGDYTFNGSNIIYDAYTTWHYRDIIPTIPVIEIDTNANKVDISGNTNFYDTVGNKYAEFKNTSTIEINAENFIIYDAGKNVEYMRFNDSLNVLQDLRMNENKICLNNNCSAYIWFDESVGVQISGG